MTQSFSSAPGQEAQRPPLIYLVDDEPMLLDLAEAALARGGYTFRKFTEPEQAYEAFAEATTKPDLLITDFAMHSMNGLELIQRCRQLHPALKVILLSGTCGEEILTDPSLQVEQFVAKPYPCDQLLGSVRRVLGR